MTAALEEETKSGSWISSLSTPVQPLVSGEVGRSRTWISEDHCGCRRSPASLRCRQGPPPERLVDTCSVPAPRSGGLALDRASATVPGPAQLPADQEGADGEARAGERQAQRDRAGRQADDDVREQGDADGEDEPGDGPLRARVSIIAHRATLSRTRRRRHRSGAIGDTCSVMLVTSALPARFESTPAGVLVVCVTVLVVVLVTVSGSAHRRGREGAHSGGRRPR